MKIVGVITKGKLVKLYKMSAPTFRKNLLKVVGIDPDKRKFTPSEVSLIMQHLGRP